MPCEKVKKIIKFYRTKNVFLNCRIMRNEKLVTAAAAIILYN